MQKGFRSPFHKVEGYLYFCSTRIDATPLYDLEGIGRSGFTTIAQPSRISGGDLLEEDNSILH